MAYDRRSGDARYSEPARIPINYQAEVGRVHVPVGVERDFVLLDPNRARTLRAWVDALIPAHGVRPAAGEVGAAEYVDATAFHASRVRALLIKALDAIERRSFQRHEVPFADAGADAQAEMLRVFEETDDTGAFAMVRDLTYEAYYANPRVLDLVERETGWQYEGAIAGSEMEPFDESLLKRMRTVKPKWREA